MKYIRGSDNVVLGGNVTSLGSENENIFVYIARSFFIQEIKF